MPSASKAKIKSALSPLFIVSIILISAVVLLASQPKGPRVNFANASVDVEIAQSNIDRKVGLGNHNSLGEGSGMLFIFELSATHGFWMENMDFPIDIIWMNEKRQIVHIENSVSPDSYPNVFYPNLPAKYVLETNSGWAKSHNVRVGDIAYFDL